MNKLFYRAVSVFALLLLMLRWVTLEFFGPVLFVLWATGLVISISKINEITKSRNSLKSKVYFSFIFSFLVFSLIIFFFAIGKIVAEDMTGIALFVTAIVAVTGFLISLMSGIILSKKRKNIGEYNYNMKPIILLSSIPVIIMLILAFYDPLVQVISKVLKNENLCSLTLPISRNNPLMFHSNSKNWCLIGVAGIKLDVSICKRFVHANLKSICYIEVATKSNDPGICKKGTDEGIKNMNTCMAIVTKNWNY